MNLFFFLSNQKLMNRLGQAMIRGEVGGAVIGVLAGLCLYWQRFGPDPWRWLGLLAVVPLPWLSYGLIDRARQNDADWKKLEKEDRQKEKEEYEKSKLPVRLGKALRACERWYNVNFAGMLRRDGDNWKDRDQDEVKTELETLAELRQQRKQLQEDLSAAQQKYRGPDILREVKKGETFLQAQGKQLALAETLLRDRDQITQEDHEQLKKLGSEVDRLRKEWE